MFLKVKFLDEKKTTRVVSESHVRCKDINNIKKKTTKYNVLYEVDSNGSETWLQAIILDTSANRAKLELIKKRSNMLPAKFLQSASENEEVPTGINKSTKKRSVVPETQMSQSLLQFRSQAKKQRVTKGVPEAASTSSVLTVTNNVPTSISNIMNSQLQQKLTCLIPKPLKEPECSITSPQSISPFDQNLNLSILELTKCLKTVNASVQQLAVATVKNSTVLEESIKINGVLSGNIAKYKEQLKELQRGLELTGERMAANPPCTAVYPSADKMQTFTIHEVYKNKRYLGNFQWMAEEIYQRVLNAGGRDPAKYLIALAVAAVGARVLSQHSISGRKSPRCKSIKAGAIPDIDARPPLDPVIVNTLRVSYWQRVNELKFCEDEKRAHETRFTSILSAKMTSLAKETFPESHDAEAGLIEDAEHDPKEEPYIQPGTSYSAAGSDDSQKTHCSQDTCSVDERLLISDSESETSNREDSGKECAAEPAAGENLSLSYPDFTPLSLP